MSTERYSPSVRVDHARSFIEVVSLLLQARDAEAAQREALIEQAWTAFQAGVGNGWLLDFGGALNVQLPQTMLVEVAVGDVANKPITYGPNQRAWYRAPRDGRAGCSISSGGSYVVVAAGAQPGERAREVSASGGTPYLDVRAGEYVSMWAEAITTARDGLYNLALP